MLFVQYALAGNRTKIAQHYNQQPGHYTDYASPNDIISKLVVRYSRFKEQKSVAYNYIRFHIIFIRCLLILIINFRSLSVSASERQAYRLWPLVPAYLFIVSVFRLIQKAAKSDNWLRQLSPSDSPTVCPLGRTMLQNGRIFIIFYISRLRNSVYKFKYELILKGK